ncbi:hypothetical protein UFOVP1369_25 [uncultured Caudovirales phage]|uniref:Uncharacterized protein n=1 Tax=uncultured Caudovirales phage TaxID=2100421 RepID=A0A6J5RZB6_9CAUD|nr:hypothetical protein UFOVP1369_25 [uncultured Caudovirales phage]
MTSSSSLYGTVNTQNTQSTNSTSLYGGADTPIPTPAGDLVVRGDLIVLSGNILTTATTGNIFPTNATTINLGLAATTLNIGANTGTTTINNALVADSGDFGNITIGVVDGNTIATTSGDLNLLPTGNNGVNITSGSDGPTLVTRNSAVTTAVRTLSLSAETSLTPAVGFGNTLEWQVEAQPGNTERAGYISVVLDDITAGSEDFSMYFGLMENGAAYTTKMILDSTGNLTTDGDITATGATLGKVTVGLGDNQTITTTTGELRVSSANNAIKLPSVTSIYTDTTGSFGLLNQPTTVNAFLAATALNLGAATGVTNINNDLTIDGTNINLAQDTTFSYSENNNRLNRPSVISTTGNTSGWRVRAPNATTSAAASMSVANTNDASNNKFLSVQATGSTTEPLRIVSGEYIAGVLNASGDSISIRDGTTTYATVNPAGPTVGTDLTTKTYVDGIVASSVTSITGTANQVIASSPTGAVTLSLPQSIGTGNTPTFAGATLGNVTVGVATDNTITTSTGNLVLKSAGGEIDTDTTTILSTNSSSFFLLNSPTTVNAFQGATTLSIGAATGTTNINNDLTIDGDSVILAAGTTIGFNGNNTRANYPTFQSTTGTVTGVRTLAPNATAGSYSQFSTFATNDINNGEFLTLRSTNSTTAPFTINTGKYTAGVVGTSGKSVNFVDNSTLYASVNPSGPTNSTDLTTKSYVDGLIPTVPTYDTNVAPVAGGAELDLRQIIGAGISIVGSTQFIGGTNVTVAETSPNVITISAPDTNTTYTVDATSTTGGANLNLTGSDASTDSVAYLGSGATTVTRTDANTITVSSTDTNTTYTQNISSTTGGANLNLVGSDATTDTVKFANGTGVTVSYTDASTATVAIGQAVATTDDVTFNTVNANITDDNYVLGQLVATRNSAYVAPASPLTTIAGQNGIVVASSSGGAGYGANIAVRYHSGDTTAGIANAASVNFSGASGTNSAPGGAATNQVLGSNAYDGYTAGTSNNYAGTIATINQGAGTTGIVPLQAQGYARQAFTNSTTVTTAVTGASGTGSVATLTFTTQNTAPYVVGQTVTVAGMTPSGYNGTYVLTAATTSSISYANATTGFTSGGTIGTANTVTAAGCGFRVRGFANSTNLSVANRFNFMDLTASAATFKSAAYTFANDVITGSTLTATNYMTLGAGGAVMAAPTTGTYASITPTSATFTNSGISQLIRTGAVAAQTPAVLIRYSRTDQTGPQDGDGVDFRLSVGGTSTTSNFARFDGQYKASGDNEIGMSVSTDSFSADTDRIYVGSRASTKIRATPAGGGTTIDSATFTQLANTFKADSMVLQTAAGVGIASSNIIYGRQYIEAYSTQDQTNPVSNAENLMSFNNTGISNGVSIVTNGTTLSRITFANAGVYNLQFSAQISQTSGGADNAFIWLKKNGTTVANTAGDTRVAGNGDRIMAAWNYVFSAAAGDYYELAWAATDTSVILDYVAAAGVVPAIPSVILTVVPVGA